MHKVLESDPEAAGLAVELVGVVEDSSTSGAQFVSNPRID